MLKYGEFQLIFLDEAHQAVNQLKTILDKLDISKSKVVGFTATPFNSVMTQIFDKINYKILIISILQKYTQFYTRICKIGCFLINT